MCFIIDSPIKYATKPIVAYKILTKEKYSNKLKSPFWGMEYKLNELYESPLCHTFNTVSYGVVRAISTFGLSAFSLFSYYVDNKLMTSWYDINEISEGLHAYTDKIRALDLLNKLLLPCMRRDKVLVRCEIPKHSWYYTNIDGEIVSDKLIVKIILE